MDDFSTMLPWQGWWGALQAAATRIENQPMLLSWGATVLALAAIVFAVRATRKVRAAERLLQRSQRGMGLSEAGDLAAGIESLWSRVMEIERTSHHLFRRIEAMADELARCVRRVSLVRFNAFENTGGEQSFSVALLDEHGDGAVLTALVGREDVRVYAKPVTGGSSTYPLSDEEREAIRRALAGQDAIGPVQRPGHRASLTLRPPVDRR